MTYFELGVSVIDEKIVGVSVMGEVCGVGETNFFDRYYGELVKH